MFSRWASPMGEPKEALAEKPQESAEEASQGPDLSLEQLPGVGEKTKELLIASGFADVEAVANAQAEALAGIKGIGKVKAGKLIKEAKKLIK